MHRVGKATSIEVEGAQLAVARAKAAFKGPDSSLKIPYQEDLATVVRLAQGGDFPRALAALEQPLREAKSRTGARMVFRLGDSAYEFNHDLSLRLGALKALFAARAGDAVTLRKVQTALGALWPMDAEIKLYGVWVDHFVPGRADQDWDDVRVKTSELLELQPGQDPQVTVIHRFKEFGKPTTTNAVTGDWLSPAGRDKAKVETGRPEASQGPTDARAGQPGRVQFFGEVTGQVELPAGRPTKLAEAILSLGKTSESADLRKVKVLRADGTTVVVDVRKVIRENRRDLDLDLRDGDRVEVPARSIIF